MVQDDEIEIDINCKILLNQFNLQTLLTCVSEMGDALIAHSLSSGVW